MKAIITLLFVLFIGISAQAQNANKKPLTKVETIEVSVPVLIMENFTNENTVARLYKFKNTKIKKELSFSTKKTKSKLA